MKNVKYVVLLMLTLLVVLTTQVSHAEGRTESLQDQLAKARWDFQQACARIDVVYDMVKDMYLKDHTQEEYEDLVFNARNTKIENIKEDR